MPRGAAFGHALDLWRSIRRDYEDFLEAEYERAAEACHDRLVNADGIARGIKGLSLFMGPLPRAERWASEELLDYWRTHRRVTFAQYERERVEAHYGGGVEEYPLTNRANEEGW